MRLCNNVYSNRNKLLFSPPIAAYRVFLGQRQVKQVLLSIYSNKNQGSQYENIENRYLFEITPTAVFWWGEQIVSRKKTRTKPSPMTFLQHPCVSVWMNMRTLSCTNCSRHTPGVVGKMQWRRVTNKCLQRTGNSKLWTVQGA